MPLPVAAQVHYRCSFDLTANRDTAHSWTDLAKQVRQWIGKRVPVNDAFGAAWFFAGGEWKPAKAPRVFVKTASVTGRGDHMTPEYWAVRFEHPCTDELARQWRVDLGTTMIDPGRFHFSLAITYSLLPNYIGDEPSSPIHTAPGIVTGLLRSPALDVRAGDQRLTADAIQLVAGKGADFKKALSSPKRSCPIVLVSKEYNTGLPKLDSTTLARLLAGAAVVYESSTSNVDKELEWLLEKDFRCWNGMVRIYQPQVDFASPSDGRRHRFFTKEDVDGRGVTTVQESIIRGIVRLSRMPETGYVTSVEDVDSKDREFRIASLKESAKSKDWIELLEKENAEINKRLRESQEEMARLQEDLENAKEEFEDRLAKLEYERNLFQTQATEALTVKAQLEGQVAALSDLETLPRSLQEVVDLIEKLYRGRVLFLQRAKESARKATLQNSNIGYQCLRAMATVLYDLHFKDRLPFRDIIKKFKQDTGFELAVGESQMTKQDKRLAALRTAQYKGQQIDISSHLKHGVSPPNCLRVHYHAHEEDKVLVIGHCGDHLDTVRTT